MARKTNSKPRARRPGSLRAARRVSIGRRNPRWGTIKWGTGNENAVAIKTTGQWVVSLPLPHLYGLHHSIEGMRQAVMAFDSLDAVKESSRHHVLMGLCATHARLLMVEAINAMDNVTQLAPWLRAEIARRAALEAQQNIEGGAT